MAEQSIQDFINQLKSPDPEERRIAAENLAHLTPQPEIISALALCLHDENKGVRDAVAFSLAMYKSPETAKAIVLAITDSNVAVRNLAGELLVQFGENALGAVYPYLKVEDVDARKFAVDVLGLIENPLSVEPLIELLQDTNDNVRYAAVEALGNIRDERAVAHLISLFNRDELLRAPIAESLGKIGGEIAGGFLLNSLTRNDTLVQFAIVEALGNLGTQQALYPLMQEIGQYTGEMRRVILRAIEGIIQQQGISLQYPETFEQYFIEALHDEERDIRISALQGLRQFNTHRACEAIIRMVGGDEEVNQLVSEILHDNPVESFKCVIEMLEAELTPQQVVLVQVLSVLTPAVIAVKQEHPENTVIDPLVEKAFEIILQLWGELSGEMRYAVLDTLMLLDVERAVPILRDALYDQEPWVRIHAIELLEHARDGELREHLQRATEDESEMVREYALRTLERLVDSQQVAEDSRAQHDSEVR